MNLARAALAVFPSQMDFPRVLPGEDGAIVLTADGSDLLVAHFGSGSISPVKVSLGTAVERLKLGQGLPILQLNDAGSETFAQERIAWAAS